MTKRKRPTRAEAIRECRAELTAARGEYLGQLRDDRNAPELVTLAWRLAWLEATRVDLAAGEPP